MARGWVPVPSLASLHAMMVVAADQFDRLHRHQSAHDVSLLRHSVTEGADSGG